MKLAEYLSVHRLSPGRYALKVAGSTVGYIERYRARQWLVARSADLMGLRHAAADIRAGLRDARRFVRQEKTDRFLCGVSEENRDGFVLVE